MTLVLLIGAGLLIRSFRGLMAVDPGYDPDHLLCMIVSLLGVPNPADAPDGAPADPDATTGKRAISYQQIADRIKALPGVKSVAGGIDYPLSGVEAAVFYTAEGQPPVTEQNRPRTYFHRATPEFFETLRTKLIAGRTFTREEINGHSPSVIVSENLVKRFWPGQDPINKRIKFGGEKSTNPWMNIVGVVGEMKYRGLPNNPTADPDVYRPWTDEERDIWLLVRTEIDPASVAPAVRQAIHEINQSIAVYDVATMNDLIGTETSRSRFTGWLMGIFASVALLLAVVGVYGVMSYAVTRRTQEIGVRMALGASRAEVLRLVLWQGLPLIATGALLGLAASFALTRLLGDLLYGIRPTDALTFASVTTLLIAIAMLACWLPALRASRVDPIQALRYE